MNSNNLIAKQQLEIETLKEEAEEMQKAMRKIYQLIYCCGGPLNDDQLKYTNKQLGIFFRFVDEIKHLINWDD